MRFAELHGHEVLGVSAGVDQLFHPSEDLDHPRILERQLAVEQLAVVVGAELVQEGLLQDVSAGIGPVADALGDRRDAGGLGFLDDVEELRLGELAALGQRHAELLQDVLVVVDLVGIGLLRQTPGLAVVGPDRARPVVDRAPVHEVVERHDVAVGDVLGLIGLEVEDVGALAGRQRGLEGRVERILLVPGDLHVQAGVGLLQVLRGGLAKRHLGRLIGLVAPDRDGHVLGLRGAVARPDRCRGERRHPASSREARRHLPASLAWPRPFEGPALAQRSSNAPLPITVGHA